MSNNTKCRFCKADISKGTVYCKNCKKIDMDTWFKIHYKITSVLLIIGFLTMFYGIFIQDTGIQNTEELKSTITTTTTTINKNNNSSLIPGISAVDVYGNLKDKGFSCSGPENLTWFCNDKGSNYDYKVRIIGESSSQILTITATVLNYSNKDTNKISSDFLSYIATIKYNNSNQIEAKNWVISNIGKNTNTVINGVRFTIYGNERTRTLIIANSNSNLD